MPRLGRAGRELEAGDAEQGGGGERPGHEDEPVRRAQRIGVGTDLPLVIPGRESPTAEKAEEVSRVERLVVKGATGEVDPEYLALISLPHVCFCSTVRVARGGGPCRAHRKGGPWTTTCTGASRRWTSSSKIHGSPGGARHSAAPALFFAR